MFCERVYPAIVGALSLWCGDRGPAEEVAPEGFARAYRDWGRVRDLDAPGAWVRRVAINFATSTFRRRRAERHAHRRLAVRARAEFAPPATSQPVPDGIPVTFPVHPEAQLVSHANHDRRATATWVLTGAGKRE